MRAVAIATPVSSHFRLAMAALEAGKHVLVEKPLALNSAQAALLVEEADRRDLVLMVDHTVVYHGSVRVGYRSGDMWAPKVSLGEALSVETQHFVDCIDQNMTPLTDGKAGLRIVRILEAATDSLRQGGCPVQL